MSALEAFAAALLLVNVALVAARNIWNYPIALVTVSLYAFVFYEARLYSDMILQGFFFIINIYGWLGWAHARDDDGVPVGWMSQAERAYWALGIAIAWMVWSAAMARWTDAAAPWIDGGIAMMSIAAQWLLARRRVENWWLWIAVDVVAVPLFAWRGLYVSSAVYLVLLTMATAGLVNWRARASRAKITA